MSNETKCDIASILRSPADFTEQIRDTAKIGRLIAFLTAAALVGAAVFGFAIGSFVDWKVALLDALKMAGVVAFSFALCCPTLYVFACMGGSRLPAVRLCALGLVSMATLGCLLAALAPILWLFSVSTETLGFIVLFSFLLGLVAVAFAGRPILGAAAKGIVASGAGLWMWLILFFIVALQTTTLVRPMLEPVGAARYPQGKCFFLEHFGKTVFME